MPNDTLISDFDRHISNLMDMDNWLKTLYYHPEFGKFFQHMVLSLLRSAIEYLLVNLREMRMKWLVK